ncbi:MAG: MBL fold metallo-hydrolase [Flavobacteriaceae bacterium]|nr:MBL fold metallo-hydrolase [Flavobacteriaceae bacterium]
MKIEQIYTGCLAQGAYYIESDGEVAIIDPLRETDPYLERTKKDKAKIKYIFETHFHADFVSGHLTLAKQTGASIVFGPTAKPNFDAIIATDGQVFKLGKISITALHTPGHTLESTTYLLKDENGKNHAIFSGDTLFLGDVGRPDLAQKASNMTQEDLAGMLYESLQNKILPLADDVIVYPAHGAGSACGKNMMKETVDTLGNQKKVNYALRKNITKEEFIREVTDGLLPPPAYFPFNVKMNKEGYDDLDAVIKRGAKPLSPNEFAAIANQTEALILDVRSQQEFAESHIPRSIFIGIDGGFAPWVGALIKDVNQTIMLVAPSGRVEEVITRLSRVGFDNTIGFLNGGIDAWEKAGKETDAIKSIGVDAFEKIYFSEHPAVFDVRKENEYLASHLSKAENTPLDNLNDFLKTYPTSENFYLHCAGGYRSIIAASILKSRGIHNLIDIAGGFGAMKDTRLEIESGD